MLICKYKWIYSFFTLGNVVVIIITIFEWMISVKNIIYNKLFVCLYVKYYRIIDYTVK